MTDPLTLLSAGRVLGSHQSMEFTLPSRGARPSIVEAGYLYGRYRIERCLGIGGMGAVYHATDGVLTRPVALKTVLSSSADVTSGVRFLREAEVLARLRHPHIVTIYDVGIQDATPFIILEYLHGQHLRALLDAKKRLDSRAALTIMLPVIAAIAYAHQQGVLHLDLKPSNVFVASDHSGAPLTKVLDFGVCMLHLVDSEFDPTRGEFAGTPAYTSPEGLRGGELSQASDQFSLGVVLYEALSGINPFGRCKTLAEIEQAMRDRRYASLSTLSPHVPAELCHVIERALSPDPAERFPNVRSLGAAIAEAAPAELRERWRSEFNRTIVASGQIISGKQTVKA